MMHRTELDKLLREYLERELATREKGITLESVHRMLSDVAEEVLRQGREIDELKLAKAVRAPMPSVQDIVEEVTGRHEIKELQEHVKAKRDSMIWWKRKRWDMMFAAIGAGATAIVMVFLNLVVWYITRK